MPYDVKKSGKKMKKTIGVAMAAACVASVQMAQAQTTLDTLKVQNLHIHKHTYIHVVLSVNNL